METERIKLSEHCVAAVSHISAMTGEEYISASVNEVQFDWQTEVELNIMLTEKEGSLLVQLWYDDGNYDNHLTIWKQIYSVIGFCQYHGIKWVAP
jgi:hypothetical protein